MCEYGKGTAWVKAQRGCGLLGCSAALGSKRGRRSGEQEIHLQNRVGLVSCAILVPEGALRISDWQGALAGHVVGPRHGEDGRGQIRVAGRHERRPLIRTSALPPRHWVSPQCCSSYLAYIEKSAISFIQFGSDI